MSKKYFNQNYNKKYTYQIITAIVIVILIAVVSSFQILKAFNSSNSVNSKLSSKSQSSSKAKILKNSESTSSTDSDNTSSYSSTTSENSSSISSTFSSSTSSVDNTSLVKKFLTDGFSIVSILYNGEDVDQAMDEGKAPQNTVHDSFKIGYILNDSEVRAMSMNSAYSQNYSITNTTVTIGDATFNYSINNGSPIFNTTNTTDSDGNIITWQLSSKTNAKEYVNAAQTQN
ncbi:hypothetical protein [Liquorilactobacillus mali]|uniref:Uncharacterized protein n=1 Tax=Liquorilactobacillus mali KCTC 3596 = DSM 20444 TaxID=1046596 RepID=J1F558_9LACO|nr:hypothetical protein [Liquorilactobacillus mali]EJF01327.1 hypothetical protein LMA_01514 [Liquorilactobacillus mali KCTC 3596 = DSM 20444]KRN07881.1 hypothetical protein FD00_GL002507 [Liquorilactobacillus mali KCTC 3596 = DSM 20444]MDC7952717.1 hypothetical protein [Liquorilactobacillus mali]